MQPQAQSTYPGSAPGDAREPTEEAPKTVTSDGREEAEAKETKPKDHVVRIKVGTRQTEDPETGAVTTIQAYKFLTALGVDPKVDAEGQPLDKGKGPKWGKKSEALRFTKSDAYALAMKYHPAEAVHSS